MWEVKQWGRLWAGAGRHREPSQTDQGDVPAAQKGGLWTQAGLWNCSRQAPGGRNEAAGMV